MIAAATAISRARAGSDVADRVRGLDEDPVRVVGRADVDLDAALEAGDVAEQHRVVGEAAARTPAAPEPGWSARTPRRCGPRPAVSAARCGARTASAGRTFVGGQRGGVAAATLGTGADELRGRRRPRGRDPRRPRPDATSLGRSRRGWPAASASARCAWRRSLAGGRLVDGRAHERVPDPAPTSPRTTDEPGGDRGLERLLAQTEGRCCAADDGELAGVVCGREQQQLTAPGPAAAGCGRGRPARRGRSGAAGAAAAPTRRAGRR